MARFSFVLLFWMITSNVYAGQGLGAVMGGGNFSCSEFAEKYRHDPLYTDTLFFYWAQGYMSGLNMVLIATKNQIHDLNAWPINTQLQIVRTFCNERPLAMFMEAVQNLYDKLPLAKSD
jgi:hypothetical protein